LFLEIAHLLDANDIILQKSKKQKEIDYSGEGIYPIEYNKLEALIEHTPSGDILDIATYYLKNIILLQPFPDGNHRTALAAVEFFLNINDYELSYSAEEALDFQKEPYRVRFKTYGNYDQHDTSILKTNEDGFSKLCRGFIKKRLTKRN
jgi:prophage maintenance system killer protein